MRRRAIVTRVTREYLARVGHSFKRLCLRTDTPDNISGTWIPANNIRILWYIQTYRDRHRLHRTLARLRKLYPESQVLVVSDGDRDPRIQETCDKYSVEFNLRPRLYGVEFGGELVQEILEAFLLTNAEVLIKIDTDTKVRRRFSLMPHPHDSSIYGTVQAAGSESNRLVSIQGGCIIVPRRAADLLVESSLLKSERLKPPALEWAVNKGAMARAASGLTSSDQTLGWACRELGLLSKDHPEVFSRYQPSLMDVLTQRRVAVFHPRFEIRHLADPVFYFSGLRVAIGDALTNREDGSR